MSGVLWHENGVIVTWEGPRDRQFHAARDILAEFGDKGVLEFEKGVECGKARITYSIGGPCENPYVRLM